MQPLPLHASINVWPHMMLILILIRFISLRLLQNFGGGRCVPILPIPQNDLVPNDHRSKGVIKEKAVVVSKKRAN
jgi:hypothetical protein